MIDETYNIHICIFILSLSFEIFRHAPTVIFFSRRFQCGNHSLPGPEEETGGETWSFLRQVAVSGKQPWLTHSKSVDIGHSLVNEFTISVWIQVASASAFEEHSSTPFTYTIRWSQSHIIWNTLPGTGCEWFFAPRRPSPTQGNEDQRRVQSNSLWVQRAPKRLCLGNGKPGKPWEKNSTKNEKAAAKREVCKIVSLNISGWTVLQLKLVSTYRRKSHWISADGGGLTPEVQMPTWRMVISH